MLTPRTRTTRRALAAAAAVALTSSALILTPLAGAVPANAAATVENYPVLDTPVDVAFLGDYGYVLNDTGVISRIDLTQPVGADAVTLEWATIVDPTETYARVDSVGIEVVGTDLYVASTMTIDDPFNDQRVVWITKIPTGDPTGIDPDWQTYDGGTPSFLTATAFTSANGFVIVASGDYPASGAGYPTENRVDAVAVDAPAGGSWTNTTADVEPASQVVAAGGWIYTRMSSSTFAAEQRLGCAPFETTGALDIDCVSYGFGNAGGDIPRAIAVDGSTAYVVLEDWETMETRVQSYTVSGGSFTPGASYPLTHRAAALVVVDGIIYAVGNDTLSAIDPTASPAVTDALAALPDGADAEGIQHHDGHLYTVNTDEVDDPATGEPIYTVSRITLSADTDGGDGTDGGTDSDAAACVEPSFVVNTGGATTALQTYSASGTLTRTVPLAFGYGDIALSANGDTVYGVKNGSEYDDTIDVIDASTGTVTSTITLTGDAAGVGGWVGAAILPDGRLVIGSAYESNVYTVDTTTGASTLWADMASADATIYATAGDFSRLPNGKEVALALGGTPGTQIVLIDDDGTATSVGSIAANAWGAGRVGNDLMIAADDGTIRVLSIADIPTTAGTSALPTRTIVTGEAGSIWGAAGSQDGETGTCPEALAHTGSDLAAPALQIALVLLLGGGAVLIARRSRSPLTARSTAAS